MKGQGHVRGGGILWRPPAQLVLLTHTEMSLFEMFYSNCCMNPVIYCLTYDRFQRNLLRMLRRCRCLAAHPGRPGTGGGRPGATTAVSRGATRVQRGTWTGDDAERDLRGTSGCESPVCGTMSTDIGLGAPTEELPSTVV